MVVLPELVTFWLVVDPITKFSIGVPPQFHSQLPQRRACVVLNFVPPSITFAAENLVSLHSSEVGDKVIS